MGKNFDDVAGKAKEAYGKATGDRSVQAEGKIDQAKADAKDTADKAKEKAEGFKEKAEEVIENAGEKIKDVFKR
ncbi:CsbD family protein [Nocardiopsis lambiniae]|uniref:CsbD family protein n=1 Tax=Nocardiopsis lambiniae TaxID=3075539 RepID=A0ABU2MEZ1_9ACTN|nr:CsbD family protein [Nocardiopsis sp. DSM 44743]MDT0331105.1 CsbD family protein [Nocardiopsis sp. DSM 44743]